MASLQMGGHYLESKPVNIVFVRELKGDYKFFDLFLASAFPRCALRAETFK